MSFAAHGVTVTAGGHAIVADASIAIAPGEVVGLVGPNGAGKSTLLKAMLGLRRRDSGSVTVDGDSFERLPPRERARRVAYLAQDGRVEWRLTVRDVVLLGRFPHRAGFGGPSAACRAAVARALDAVDAADLAERAFATLSGGERARALLARALAVEAGVLLVDEPTAALDPYHQIHVMEILRREARRGAGVLVVLHDLALAARFTDRLVMMNAGAVAREGAPADVLAPEVLEDVYRVAALRGEEDGQPWVLPWARTGE